MTTTSLQTSRLLKENGFEQASSFTWMNTTKATLQGIAHPHACDGDFGLYPEYEVDFAQETYAAPTADEILDRLGDVKHHGNEYFLSIGHGLDAKWQLDYRDTSDGQLNAWVGDNLAELAAQAWLFLKKENLL